MPHHCQHHTHKKKQVQQKYQQPEAEPRFLYLDGICTVFSVLMPMTAIPQIYKLYSLQDASSLSIWMWILYCIGVTPFLLYGIINRVTHLIVLNVLWMIVQSMMIIGIILYS